MLCGRYVNEHMLFHWLGEQHSMVLSYSDLSVWCYQCDQYVDNLVSIYTQYVLVYVLHELCFTS